MKSNGRFFQLTSRSLFTLSALLFVTLLLWISTGYPPRARYVPQVIAVFSLVCLVVQFVLDSFPALANFYKKIEKEGVFSFDEQIKMVRAGEGSEFRLELIAYFWLAVLLGGLLLLGFLISIPLYILLYLHFQAQMNWPKSALHGAGTWVFVYLLFGRLFEIRLYPGILIELFFDF